MNNNIGLSHLTAAFKMPDSLYTLFGLVVRRRENDLNKYKPSPWGILHPERSVQLSVVGDLKFQL